ncbi:cyclase family protein [Candidatus Margulisiibacteriota bacterium]
MCPNIIKLGNSKFEVINLTEPLKEDIEVFPGDPKPQKSIYYLHQKDGCQYHVYAVGDHNYHPHGDAPSHQNPENMDKGYEFWDMEYVFNKACLIDLSGAEESINQDGIEFVSRITAEHIAPHIAQIKESTALVFRTGYDRWLEANKKHDPHNIPYIDKEAVELIEKCKWLKVIGIDSLTIDRVGDHYAHRKLRDRLIVECLVNLYSIPQKHRQSFYLQTSPVAIVGATGGPILAYAYMPLSEKVKK